MSSTESPPPGGEPTTAEPDQTASDQDQRAADADQSTSDADASASRTDQAQSNSDQRASDRDQRASDRELEVGGISADSHEDSTRDREQASAERDAGTLSRTEAANERADSAARRDAAARLRELAAESRDRAAELRDQAAAVLDEQFDSGSGSARSVNEFLVELRERAAADRRRAEEEIRRAHLDDLTGVYRRESGTSAILREINRAQHGDGLLVLAFVDVDKLKQVNDGQGHAAGDALLREVVAALKEGLRSYDPIVRLGGDEFVCALAGATLEEAERRIAQIREEIVVRGGSISVGLTELREGDTLESLMERGDAELYRAKGRSRQEAAS